MGPHPVPLLHLPIQGPFTPLTVSPQCHSPAFLIHSPFPHFQNIFHQHVNMWHCKASQPANTLYSSWPVLSAHTQVMQPLPGVRVLQPSTEELQGSSGISLALRSSVELCAWESSLSHSSVLHGSLGHRRGSSTGWVQHRSWRKHRSETVWYFISSVIFSMPGF